MSNMNKEENTGKVKMLLNRIGFLVLGGLLTFGIVSTTVTRVDKSEIERLTAELDSVRFGAGNLLEAGKAHFAVGDYAKAAESLEVLIDRHPGSPESIEGITLLTEVRTEKVASDALWEDAMPEIRNEWVRNKTDELQQEADATRAETETTIEAEVQQAWDRAIDGVRRQWEDQQS